MGDQMAVEAYMDQRSDQPADAGKVLAAAALAIFTAAAIIFSFFPAIDLAIAHKFYLGNGRFVGEAAWIRFMREGFKAVFFGASIACATGLVLAMVWRRIWLGIDGVRWLYLAVCLITGPGIVANLALKDEWGRARPNQIAEFGGTREFSPALLPSDQCVKNCSFVSGEASSIFMIFFASALLFRTRSVAIAAAGTFSGFCAGVVRMSQGGHFLSDVVFAGIAMSMTAIAVHLLFTMIATAALASRDFARPAVL